MSLDHLREGAKLARLVHTPTSIQLFRYSAVTWNSHRIHFDDAYAKSEGHVGCLVHSHLHAALVLRHVEDQLGEDWFVKRFRYQLRSSATAGDELRFDATVTDVSAEALSLEVIDSKADGTVCLQGSVDLERKHD